MLRGGQATVFAAPSFLPMGKLVQLDDDRFLGVSTWIQTTTRFLKIPWPVLELEEKSSLAEIRLLNGSIEAKPSPIGTINI